MSDNRRFKDLTGQTFKIWKAVKRVENDKFHRAQYLCEYIHDASITKVFTSAELKRNKFNDNRTLTMGEDLTGKVFGRWTVLGKDKDRKRGHWYCKCSCGDTDVRSVSGSRLRDGDSKSCGCYAKERISEANSGLQKPNEYYIEEDIVYMKSNNSDNYFYFNKKHLDVVRKYAWHEESVGYVVSMTSGKTVQLHNLLFYGTENYKKRGKVDHADRNNLNNLDENLRQATKSQQQANRGRFINNTSGFTGVYWKKQHNKWQASLTYKGKYMHLGFYDDKDEAVKARLKAEKEHLGEFSPQQHLYEEYGIE